MLAFGIRYLNGFVAAAEPDNLGQAEWPPHPGRVFMALAAAHFQTGADPAEREALLWLEGTERGGEISPPAVVASEAMERSAVTSFVPVNDKSVWKKDPAKPDQGPPAPLQSAAGIMRVRNPRVFARAWLEEDTVYLVWRELEPSTLQRETLASLCGKVTRIGHSISLVQMWLADPEVLEEPSWVPDDKRGTLRLRIPGPGTLDDLRQRYNAEAVEDYAGLKVTEMETEDSKARKAVRKRLCDEYANEPPPQHRPRLALEQGYARPTPDIDTSQVTGTVFSLYPLMLRLDPAQSQYKALDLVATLTVTNRWREAILSHSNGLSEPVRRMLSGHDSKGGPAKDPHFAFLPLAFVGSEHADGHLLGMGLALPDGLSREDRGQALRAIAAVRELRLGPLGVWRVEAITESRPAWNLRPEAWTTGAEGVTHWSTVTPIAFDRHPKAKDRAQYQQETAQMIADACTRIGLPRPREVIVTHVSAHFGAPPSFSFPRIKRKDGSKRRHTHAILVFDEPVCGPISIGAGRFRGYGACRPLQAKDTG